MAITVNYNKIWKWIAIDWTTRQVFYWDDFNPRQFTRPTSYTSVSATDETTSFNLSNFQAWNEVWCWVIKLTFPDGFSWLLYARFERSSDWINYDTQRQYYWNIDESAWNYWAWYIYFWIDYDEIRPWYNYYRIWYHSADGTTINFYSPTFTVSNLSFDNSWHRWGYMWVEWENLCFVDSCSLNKWFKHKINRDTWYTGTYVWTDKAWYVRIPEYSNDSRLYYVDATWYTRRTKESQNWYDIDHAYAWSSYAWFIWVSDGDYAEDWYAHLCWIDSAWSKRRICNWWIP